LPTELRVLFVMTLK